MLKYIVIYCGAAFPFMANEQRFVELKHGLLESP